FKRRTLRYRRSVAILAIPARILLFSASSAWDQKLYPWPVSQLYGSLAPLGIAEKDRLRDYMDPSPAVRDRDCRSRPGLDLRSTLLPPTLAEQHARRVLHVALVVVRREPCLLRCSRTLQRHGFGIGVLLLQHAEVIVVNQPDSFHSVAGGDICIVDRQQIVAVRLFTAFGQVGRTGKHRRLGAVEVDDDKLVMDHLPGTSAELRGKRRRYMLAQVREGCELSVLG